MTQAAPLTSEHWFRVAGLKPRLDPRARVQRVQYRRQPWHVVTRADGTRSFRLNATAYGFVARCNGALTMQRLWDILLQEWADDAPSQDELLRLLARLHAAALVSFDRRPDFGPQGVLPALEGTSHLPRSSLLSMRVPLGQPQPLLNALYPRLRWLFQPAVLGLWFAVVVAAALAAVLHLGMLAHLAGEAMASPRMLLLTWACYPTVKVLHELGHGLAARHLGARVPEWGVTVMMFVPVPYVDASATSAYAARRQRLLVSGAGIVVELFLASIGLAVVLNAQPGWVHDIGLSLFLIGAVSTVLVNGNPLMRFDGYHMLCDALGLPNLAPRSSRWWMETLRQRVLGEQVPEPLVPAPGEGPWLRAFAPASLLWRWAVVAGLVLWLGSISFLLGLCVGALMAYTLLARPLWAFITHLRTLGAGPQGAATAARRRGLALLAGGVLAVCALPLPFASVVQGVVWPAEEALLRVHSDGFVARLLVPEGAIVQPGQALLQLESPTLQAEQLALQARGEALQAERFELLRGDPERAASLERDLQALQVEVERNLERLEGLTLRAQVAGRVAFSHARDLPGRYLKQGSLVGHVVRDEPSRVRVAMGQEQAALWRDDAPVQVRLAEHGRGAWAAVLERDTRAAVHRLPSAALGALAGGPIATDPADPQGLAVPRAVVLADVRLPVNLGERIGARAWVRVDHGHAPLAWQAARSLQQVFLRHFNPSH